MYQIEMRSRHIPRFSLSLRISLLLIVSAILPLIITVAVSELLSRPALTDQAQRAMETDARSRVQLIDTYLTERLLDAETLSQVPSLQAFMLTPPEKETPDLITHAVYALAAGIFRDSHYAVWSLFDPQGNLRLYYPTTTTPKPHGQYLIPPEDLQAVKSGKAFISAVFFDPLVQRASVDIYAPVIVLSSHRFLGIARATLYIDYIWNIVNGERGANGDGSYAFILDENGVRIADTEPSRRFSAIAPLSPQTQQIINSEARYGNNSPVSVLADDAIVGIQQNAHPPISFQVTPARQSEPFQVIRLTSSLVSWSYFVLSPINTVLAVANQQLLITSLVAFCVLVVAALIGLLVGRRLTRPLLSSVDYLRDNIQALNTLATGQRDAALRQTWVVDFFMGSSEMGLQAMHYYSHATKVASHRLSGFVAESLLYSDQFDARTAKQVLEKILNAAQYIERAAQYQAASRQRLETATQVMGHVNDRLVESAISAAEASKQLELVVNQLKQVIGK